MGLSIALATSLSTAISAVSAVVGGTLGIVGGVMQHNEAKQQAKIQEQNEVAQRRQMEYNKRLAEREAAQTEAATQENVRRQRLQAEELQARQRAMLGKSGAAMTSGSPLAVLGQTAADEELKIQDTAYQGYNKAMQSREQAKMYGYQAKIHDYNAAAARASSPSGWGLALNIAGQANNMIGSLASTGSNYIGTSSSLKQSGMWNKKLF